MPAATFRPKILVVGPSGSGKTALSNTMANLADSLSTDYEATAGVRILEFERTFQTQVDGKKKQAVLAEIELWDCSGDIERWGRHMASFAHDAHGVIIVLSASQDSALSVQAADMWYSTLKSRGFDPDQLAIVLPTRTASTREKHALTKEKPLSKVACHTLPLSTRAEDQEVVRHELDKLLDRVYLKVAGTA